jgi:hypothetical protein
MKILYVEDELSKNVDRIILLFSDYLSKKQRNALQALIANENGFRIDLKEVKSIVESTNVIEVEWRFPDALRKIIYCANRYDLFVIDRNLSEQDYDYDEVEHIDHSYNKNLYETYFGREGDYFLHRLIRNIDVVRKFFFLTAYSAADELRNSEDIKTLIDLGNFKTLNFIEKGNKNHIERLQYVMKNSSAISLRATNTIYISILEKYLGEEAVDSFLKVLGEESDVENFVDILGKIRNTYQQILKECAERIPHMKEYCLNERGNIILGKETINGLKNDRHINEIRKNFFFSIKTIASDLSSHRQLGEDKPTIEAIKALIYQLKDMILWFSDICNKYQK